MGLNTRCGDPSGNPWVSLVGGLGASWMAGFKWNYLNQPSKRQRFRSCCFGHGPYGGQTTKKLPFHAVDPFGKRVKMFKKHEKLSLKLEAFFGHPKRHVGLYWSRRRFPGPSTGPTVFFVKCQGSTTSVPGEQREAFCSAIISHQLQDSSVKRLPLFRPAGKMDVGHLKVVRKR